MAKVIPAGNRTLTVNEAKKFLHAMTVNARSLRSSFVNSFSERKNINASCDYPDTESITPEIYLDMFDRESIATRVVEVLSRESWLVSPTVYETEDPEQTTAFEQDWADIGKGLRGESWYEDSEGNPIWEYLQRLDIRSGIGHYGVMLLGLDDGSDLKDPVVPKKGMKLNFLRVFDESMATITAFETDEKESRFGQPTQYNLMLNEPSNIDGGGMQVQGNMSNVHWSRIIHVVDNPGSSEVFGTPRQQPVWNRLLDLRKLYGGSAEMYWQGAFPGFSIEGHPQLAGELKFDEPAMRTALEKYMTGLQRWLIGADSTVKSLAPQVVDPTPQINIAIEAICIRLAIPNRVFTGSERGELASSQDKLTWNDRISARQNDHCIPRLIVPLVDRLIAFGVLSQPKSYNAVFPQAESLTMLEQSEVAVNRTEAMAKYVQAGVEGTMTPLHFFTKILGLTDKEAEEIVSSATEAVEAEETMTLPDPEQEVKVQKKYEIGEFAPPIPTPPR